MTSPRLGLFLENLVKLKETLQESLHLFRQAQRRIDVENPEPNTFMHRRLIQLERDALIRFKNDVNVMNVHVEKLLAECEKPLEHSTDWEAFQLISKELKSIKNAFDKNSPALEAALQKVETRLQFDK